MWQFLRDILTYWAHYEDTIKWCKQRSQSFNQTTCSRQSNTNMETQTVLIGSIESDMDCDRNIILSLSITTTLGTESLS